MDNPESAFQMSPDQAQNHKIRPVLGKKNLSKNQFQNKDASGGKKTMVNSRQNPRCMIKCLKTSIRIETQIYVNNGGTNNQNIFPSIFVFSWKL